MWREQLDDTEEQTGKRKEDRTGESGMIGGKIRLAGIYAHEVDRFFLCSQQKKG